MLITQTIRKVKQYSPNADTSLLKKAYLCAKKAHEGQFRYSGEPYVYHPLKVALILAELELDVITVSAGILHDTLEDTDVTSEILIEQFGQEVYELVEGVTKLSRIMFESREERQAESLRKMFLAMARDIRVVMIRLADRMHNMRTLDFMSEERKYKIAEETLEIYAPLAHRLGMWRLKWELEDLALRHLEPEQYYALVEKVAKQRKEREAVIENAIEFLKVKVSEMDINAEITGRPKHFYSIYQKMTTQHKSFDEIFDLIGIRIIVDTVKDCYAVLGLVHTLFKPIPGRFKDYIAVPKSNMYQSLHTTIIGPSGDPLEIQVRTKEMHLTAEFGIAAHWKYKEGIRNSKEFDEKIAWLRQVLEWQKDMKDVQDFMEILKVDLFEDEVFVFTPKGDVKSLPAGSTPVDFAYNVHTHIGHSCIGAKVNGRIVPIDYNLKNGDIVEILTSKAQTGPSKDWLNFVKFSKAKSKIRQWFKEEHKEENILKGKDLLEKELRKHNVNVSEMMEPDRLKEMAIRFGFRESDDLLAATGYGKVAVRQVVNKLVPQKPHGQHKLARLSDSSGGSIRGTQGIRVKGVENLLVKFARCCNPVPGDAIIGYITRGRGVSIHQLDCPNIAALDDAPERYLDVEWDSSNTASYCVEIQIEGRDRVGLLADIMATISEMKTNISAVTARKTKTGNAVINMTVEIKDVPQVNAIMERVKKTDGVIDVFRPGSH
jgi:guanosine-3',5'-bis(diphosphate) 3'-pyrophosphohydrolase